jgi:predicted lipid carrier protein YhbT
MHQYRQHTGTPGKKVAQTVCVCEKGLAGQPKKVCVMANRKITQVAFQQPLTSNKFGIVNQRFLDTPKIDCPVVYLVCNNHGPFPI